MKNLTLENIAKAVEGKLFHGENIPADTEAEGVVIDSRQVGKNYIFVAIKGERVDGHDFARDVFEKGALAMIAERELDTLMYNDSVIFRDQQFTKANTISLQTMDREIKLLWNTEMKYRPNFSTADGTVNMPVIFSKISVFS